MKFARMLARHAKWQLENPIGGGDTILTIPDNGKWRELKVGKDATVIVVGPFLKKIALGLCEKILGDK